MTRVNVQQVHAVEPSFRLTSGNMYMEQPVDQGFVMV